MLASSRYMEKQTERIPFDELFRTYKNRFMRFAQSYIRDPVLAEDFVMDALVYYWENRNRLKDDCNIPAYILTTIKHKCLNHLQHQKLTADISEKLAEHSQWELEMRIATLQACDPEELFAAEAQEIVNQVLKNMPERTRQVFLMSRFENKTNREISIALNITLKTVEFHITKALKELKLGLKDYLPLFFYLFL